jgi:hypothetical protein
MQLNQKIPLIQNIYQFSCFPCLIIIITVRRPCGDCDARSNEMFTQTANYIVAHAVIVMDDIWRFHNAEPYKLLQLVYNSLFFFTAGSSMRAKRNRPSAYATKPVFRYHICTQSYIC